MRFVLCLLLALPAAISAAAVGLIYGWHPIPVCFAFGLALVAAAKFMAFLTRPID